VLYNQLKAKKPVILTYMANQFSGHAVVITGIEATVINGGVRVTRVHIFDPFSFRQVQVPTVVQTFFGPRTVPLQSFEADASLIIQDYPITSWGNQVILPGHGTVTGMILVDGSSVE
jgi:hypothetical protein